VTLAVFVGKQFRNTPYSTRQKNPWLLNCLVFRSLRKELRELVEYPLVHPELYAHLGVDPPTGVLLFGSSGCGKTLLARAIGGELGVYFRQASKILEICVCVCVCVCVFTSHLPFSHHMVAITLTHS
jgi:AAA+ superfamily predicted ATPase